MSLLTSIFKRRKMKTKTILVVICVLVLLSMAYTIGWQGMIIAEREEVITLFCKDDSAAEIRETHYVENQWRNGYESTIKCEPVYNPG